MMSEDDTRRLALTLRSTWSLAQVWEEDQNCTSALTHEVETSFSGAERILVVLASNLDVHGYRCYQIYSLCQMLILTSLFRRLKYKHTVRISIYNLHKVLGLTTKYWISPLCFSPSYASTQSWSTSTISIGRQLSPLCFSSSYVSTPSWSTSTISVNICTILAYIPLACWKSLLSSSTCVSISMYSTLRTADTPVRRSSRSRALL